MQGTVGEIRLFAGNYEPVNWKFCDGSTIQIQANALLFSVIGSRFGGDGRTDFALPDLRNAAPVAPQNQNSLGDKKTLSGAESDTGNRIYTLELNYIICVNGDDAPRN